MVVLALTDEGADQHLLLCDICDRGFHTFCLKVPLEEAPEGRWVCDECVHCKNCGATSPGKSGAKWQKEYSYCV
jgi:hypothetical protein